VRRRDERGSSLLLVLVVVTVIGLGLSALLSRSSSAERVSQTLREQAEDSYAADGAMEAAINNLRNSTYNHESGQHCFGLSDTLPLILYNGLDSAAVTCRPDPKQVIFACRSGDCNRPANAVLTLGRIAGEAGVSVDQPAGSTVRIHGALSSSSAVDAGDGQLAVTGALSALGGCSGSVLGNPLCDLTSLPSGDDPRYPSLTAVPAHRGLPACTTPNSVVAFQPGSYDDAEGLSSMMSSGSACRGSTWWFKPGVYYFDFQNSANPLLVGGSHLWTVGSGNLVGGTPTAGAVPAMIPGSCASPLNGAGAGVQFVFGGDSRLDVASAAKAELCGTYSTSAPPIALRGLTTGSASTVELSGLKPSAVSLLSKFLLTATPGRLGTVDGVSATWKSTTANGSAGVTINGFAPPDAIPAGSVLRSAALKVTHRHSDLTSADKLDLSIDVGSVAPLTASVDGGPGSATYRTETVPLDVSRAGPLAQSVYAGTFTGASIGLTARLPVQGDTEDIDAVQLELSYSPPAMRAADGCVTEGPYPSNTSACALVSGRVFVQGTVYAPDGVLDLAVGPGEPAVGAGVVVRSLRIRALVTLSGVAIDLPSDSPGFTFGVQLVAYICPGALLCSASGRPALQARIGLVDADPSRPVAGRRAVTVLGWWRTG
jgi:Tfp pilus assembly protein PilX